MRTIFSILILLNFGAKAEPVCPKFFSCGTFKLLVPNDSGGNTEESVTITGKSEFEAEFDYVVKNGGVVDHGAYLRTIFSEDGGFRMTDVADGKLYATGICAGGLCTWAMVPKAAEPNGMPVGRVGMFGFDGDKMVLQMTTGVPGRVGASRRVMSKSAN